ASSVWAPDCDSFRLHSRVPTAHARVALRFVNGPVVFWDLSRVPKDYRERGGRTTSASDRLGDNSRRGSGYLSSSGTGSPKVPILNGEWGTKAYFPFWVELC
ncbi:unnamed protein product, partial [Staurois parvus]